MNCDKFITYGGEQWRSFKFLVPQQKVTQGLLSLVTKKIFPFCMAHLHCAVCRSTSHVTDGECCWFTMFTKWPR